MTVATGAATATTTATAGLLHGVRVLDLTTILAGPFAAYQLALMGADVIKVEIPGTGDLARELGSEGPQYIPMMGPSFIAQNCGKRSIAVDLKTAEGKEIFTRLIRDADVLLENMRPGVLDGLGFPWARLHEINESLIYCALSGFGQTGPLARRPAYDQIIQGMAGMIDVTGFPDDTPIRAGFPIADTLGGFASAMAVCAALSKRGTDGIGCFLDVSMLETALCAMGWAVSDHLIAGREVGRNGNANATSSPSGMFRTADVPLNIAANTQQQFATLCGVLGCTELLDDPRFLTRGDRKDNREALTRELELRLAAKGAAEWEALVAEAGIPAGRVFTVAQAVEQPQVRQRELVHEIDLRTPDGSPIRVLGSGVHVDGHALAPSSRSPWIGEHTDAILADLGYTDEQIATLHDSHVVQQAQTQQAKT